MSLNNSKLRVAILSLTILISLAPQLAAQIGTEGGFIAAPAAKAAADSGSESPARPVAKADPKGDKVASFGNLMIVYFEEPGLAHYAGTIPGLEATSAAARGDERLDPQSAASRAYLRFLNRRQDDYLTRIQQKLSRDVQPVFRYRAAVAGVAVQMSRAEGKQVEKIPGVVRVIPDRVAHLTTDRGAVFIGATAIWNGSATGGLPGTQGEGVVVGILDSGVNMDHPSFAETGGDGYTHINPNGSGVFLGWCDPGNPNHDPAYVCNDKLIGGWDYMDAFCVTEPSCNEADGPEDDNGHGSHTASTTAGNFLVEPGALGISLAGISPHSNIIVYDVCYTNLLTGQGLCPFSGTSAAADQAILDGVDAINYSISGGTDPWGGDIDTFFLENMMAGTFVAASAGNGGPAAGTVNHLGPWLTTVAASTHDRGVNSSTLTDLSGGTPPADLDGASTTKGFGPATIVHAADAGDAQCLTPFAPGTWSGEIVACDRGSIARVLKCAHVAAGGAGGCVLANVTDATDPAPVIAPDPHVIPAIHVNTANGDALRAWLATPGVKTASITPAVIVNDPAAADIMADFSSRGPNDAFSVLKPDVSNPGVNILAAVASGDPLFPAPEFGWISGTSMSSPHTAGSGALLKSLHSDWTPLEIKSALMMTATPALKKEDGVTDVDAWDVGAGRVNLKEAGRVALVLDETYENFLATDPSMGRRTETLNIASLKHSACVTPCTWERTFYSPVTLTAPAGTGLIWDVTSTSGDGVTVTADSFQLDAGETVTVEFTAEAPGTNPGDPPVFAQVILKNNGDSPRLHLPVVLTVAENNFFTDVTFPTDSAVDSRDLEGLEYFEPITDLTVVEHGLVQGAQTDVVLDQDPTNGDPYDNLSQVFWKTVDVTAGSLRLFAATESDEAPDADLFVGTGGTPSAATQQCASTTATADELCTIDNPAAGTWWILVQNWQGSMDQPDLIRLLDGLVPDTDMGNLTVTGPPTVAASEPFTVNVAWDLSTMNLPEGAPGADLWFGAFSLAKDGVSAPIETTFVTIELDVTEIFADGFESGDTSAWTSTTP